MKRTNDVRTNKGITLIALVITIIVMLILVAVTVTMAVNGGLFDYARRAGQETNQAISDEQKLAEGSIMDAYLYGTTEEVISLPEYAESLLDEDTGVLTANTKYISGGSAAVIPKGFKVSEVPAEQTIANGLVIEDEEENQFVWVPVAKGTFERTGWWENEPTTKTIEEITENFTLNDYKNYIALYAGYEDIEDMMQNYNGGPFETYLDLIKKLQNSDATEETLEVDTIEYFKKCYKVDSGWGKLNDDFIETAENDPTGEYTNMVNSVNTYGGFYIGRYEAGSNENRKTSKTDETVLVKKGALPYNYVCWAIDMENYEAIKDGYGHGAVYLSLHMYDDKDVGVTSTLCYGAQWDATLKFIKDKVNVTDSTTWGNYGDSTFEFSGGYSSNYGANWSSDTTTKPKRGNYILATGVSDKNKAKNIYDLAGNVLEWTMEAFSTSNRVVRGGQSINPGGGYPASWRNVNSPKNVSFVVGIGFRPTLYITSE